MIDNVGAKLKKARVAKKVAIERAAKETRIRVDRLEDIERDDFTNFPNLAYAKGFLTIYARYLGVDISEYLRSFDTGNPIGTQDYGYLNRSETTPRAPREEAPSGPNPLFILLGFIALCIALLTTFHLYTGAQRLGLVAAPPGASPTPEPVLATPTPPPAPAAGTAPAAPAAPAAPPVAAAIPAPAAAPVATPAPTAAPVQELAAEIILRPHRKTRVTIRPEGAADPIFDDLVYADEAPLKLRGARLHITLDPPAGATIFRNGQPVAATAPTTFLE
jgi:cytoskeletal protein RodZ